MSEVNLVNISHLLTMFDFQEVVKGRKTTHNLMREIIEKFNDGYDIHVIGGKKKYKINKTKDLTQLVDYLINLTVQNNEIDKALNEIRKTVYVGRGV